MPDSTAGKHGDIRGATTDIHHADTQLFLILGENGVAGCQLLQDDVIHFKPAALHAFLYVLGGIDRAGHQMNLCFQAHTGHAHGFLDAFLAVDHELLGQNMENLLVCRNRNRLGGVNDPVDVGLGDLTVTDCNNAVGIQALDVAAGNTRIHRVNAAPGHQFRLFHRALNCLDGGFNIHHHSTLEAP